MGRETTTSAPLLIVSGFSCGYLQGCDTKKGELFFWQYWECSVEVLLVLRWTHWQPQAIWCGDGVRTSVREMTNTTVSHSL